MTLADLIQKYLENRRKNCEQKARYLDWSNNSQYYTDRVPDDNTINIFNVNYFSNNLDPKSNDSSSVSRIPKRETFTKISGVSKTSRVITLPDGTVQVETIIRDSSGNTEKHVTHQKDGKKYTTIARRNAAGIEEIEKKVTDANSNEKFETFGFSSNSQRNNSDDYNYWFNKFFQPFEGFSNSMSQDVPIFTPNDNDDEQIEKIIKDFSNAGFFEPFSAFKKRSFDDEDNYRKTPFSNDIFGYINDSNKSLGSFDVSEFVDKEGKKYYRKKHKEMEKTLKNMFPTPPSMFDQFAEDALVELPEEETPLDRFKELDEERLSKLKSRSEETEEIVKKLDEYMEKYEKNGHNANIYSDIEDNKDLNIYSMMPTQPSTPSLNDFTDVFKKAFDTRHFSGKNTQTKMYIDNGKKRIESIIADSKGNVERNITYSMGDKEYTVKVITDRYGKQIKKERNLNFPESELQAFKSRWSGTFQSDFSDD